MFRDYSLLTLYDIILVSDCMVLMMSVRIVFTYAKFNNYPIAYNPPIKSNAKRL